MVAIPCVVTVLLLDHGDSRSGLIPDRSETRACRLPCPPFGDTAAASNVTDSPEDWPAAYLLLCLELLYCRDIVIAYGGGRERRVPGSAYQRSAATGCAPLDGEMVEDAFLLVAAWRLRLTISMHSFCTRWLICSVRAMAASASPCCNASRICP